MSKAASFQSLLIEIVDNRGKTCPVAESGTPLISTNCVKNRTLYPIFEKIRYVAPDTYHNWFRGHPKPGDMVFVTKGSPGEVCWVPEPVGFCIAQDMVAIRADNEKIYPKYLFAALRSPCVRHDINSMHVGTLIPHFKKGDFDKLSIPLPHRSAQKAIGDLHFALCEKIELNRRTNETLESMARALFKDWFVDFGPTRAKAKGLAPYLAPELWELFPDKLDSEGTPEGWETKPLKDCLERLRVGKLYNQKSVLPAGRVPVLDQGKSGIIGFHDNEANIEASPKRRVSVFANHTCLQRLLDFNFSTIQNVIPFIGYQLPTEWVHYASLGKQNFEEYRGHWPSFIVHSVTVPTTKLASTYAHVVDPLLLKISANHAEKKILAHTRDLLLPKLMSGEIRLAEAEKVVETMA